MHKVVPESTRRFSVLALAVSKPPGSLSRYLAAIGASKTQEAGKPRTARPGLPTDLRSSTVAKLQPQPRAAPLLLACDARPLTQRPIPMLLASWPSPPLIQRHMLQNKLRSAQGFGTPARGTSARSATRVSKIHSHVIVQNRRTDRFVLQTDLDSVQGLTRAPCTFPNPSSSAQASIMQGMHSSRRSKPTLGR